MRLPVILIALFASTATLAPAAAQPAAAGDAAAGKRAFNTACGACHAAWRDGDGPGPSLWGVSGRKAGSGTSFDYSPALKQAGEKGLTWTDTALDQFLAKPQAAVPGTQMPVSTPDPKTRLNIIAYLATLKD